MSLIAHQFTGTDGVNLSTLTPATGAAWAKDASASGDYLVIGNTVYGTGPTNTLYTPPTTMPGLSADIQTDVTLMGGAGANVYGIACCVTAGGSRYFVGAINGAGYVFKYASDGTSLTATLAGPTGTMPTTGTHTVLVQLRETPTGTVRITLFCDGSQILQVSDGAPLTGRRVGLQSSGVSTSTTGAHYDNFAASSALVIGYIGDSITAGTVNANPTVTAPPVYAGTYLAASDTTRNVYVVNQGVSGSTTADWAVGSSNYNTAKAAFAAAGVSVVSIMLGTNDAKVAVATTDTLYLSRMAGIAADLTASGYTVVLNQPPYVVPGSFSTAWDSTGPTRIQSYIAKLNVIVNRTAIRQGSTDTFAHYQANQSELQDGVHPTIASAQWLGNDWGTAYDTQPASPTSPSSGDSYMATENFPSGTTPLTYTLTTTLTEALAIVPAGVTPVRVSVKPDAGNTADTVVQIVGYRTLLSDPERLDQVDAPGVPSTHVPAGTVRDFRLREGYAKYSVRLASTAAGTAQVQGAR